MIELDISVDEWQQHWLNIEDSLSQLEDQLLDPSVPLDRAQQLATVAIFLRAILLSCNE
jgi:hypothetical protein